MFAGWYTVAKLQKQIRWDHVERWEATQRLQSNVIFLQFRLGKNFSVCCHRLPIPPVKEFFRWTWTSILQPESRVSWVSPNIWRDTVSESKWTHRLLKEGDNLERSLNCASWGCYPRLSGGGSNLIKKASIMERLLWRMSPIEHRSRQFMYAESPVPARVVSAIRPGLVFFLGVLVCFPPLTTLAHTCWCSYQGQFKKRARNTLCKAKVWVRVNQRCNRHVWTTWTTLAHTHIPELAQF